MKHNDDYLFCFFFNFLIIYDKCFMRIVVIITSQGILQKVP